MKRLVLIDGHAILHRAFHALPPSLTNASGEQTNAVYGFTTMMLRVLTDLKPDYLAVCFDLPAPTFRQQLYTAYQSRRPEMSPKLDRQIPMTHEMLKALKIPIFEVAGYEADDCIGTLATQAGQLSVLSSQFSEQSQSVIGQSETEEQKTGKQDSENRQPKTENFIEVFIVTGDRDMLQLASDRVKVYVPIKGLKETKTYDQKLVVEEFGVKPNQWVDVKALKGDASDNYPGVAGVGPKTACELIAKYGTLEEVYRRLEEIKGKNINLALKLAEGAESAGLGKKLAQIATDVPIHLDLRLAQVDQIDWKAGIEYMRADLGFNSIPGRIEKEILGKGMTGITGKTGRTGKKNKKGGGEDGSNQVGEEQMKLI